MQCVTILYPNKASAKFDFDYFIKKHIPMTTKAFGNVVEVRKGISSPFGSPVPFICLVRIVINSVEEFLSVMKQQGAELIADMPNYTNIEPLIQFDEVLLHAAQ